MESTALLEILAWLVEHPIASVLTATGVPILFTLVAELRRRRRRVGPETAGTALPPVPASPQTPVTRSAAAPAAAQPAAAAAPIAPAAAPEPALPPAAAVPSAREAPAPVVEVPAAPPPPSAAPPPARLRDRLRRTREALVGGLGALFADRRADAEILDELEMLLMGADLGVRTAVDLLGVVRERGAGADAEAVQVLLRDAILAKLLPVEVPAGRHLDTPTRPHVVLVLGVNGSGKTTSIGKLAARYVSAGKQVVLGAGDTFRAAAIEQLQIWGERVGCPVIAGSPGSDPSAVAFDAVKAAVARDADVCIIDTAGRLQTKKPLMEELGKLVRVIGRNLEGAPHETLLVLDSNTGQNAISQARLFSEVAGVSGLVLTKLDGTAKGGVIVGLADELGIPVKFVGVGEAIEDLRDFSARDFVDALFESGRS